MHVVKVETNLKVGAVAQIGPKTLIVGENRSGKSTITNAVELALTGRVSDVAGRATLAKDAELWTLVPPNYSNAFAQVRLDDGTIASWTLVKGKRAVRDVRAPSDKLAVEIAFPLREVYENLTGTPETARKWLLDKLDAVPWDAVEIHVSSSQHERLAALTGKVVSNLPTALETAKSQARASRTRAESLRDQVRAIAATIPTVDLDDNPADRIADMQKRLGETQVRLGAAKEKLTALNAKLKALPAVDQSSADVAEALLVVIGAQVKNGATKCVVCSRENPPKQYTDRQAAVKATADGILRNAAAISQVRQEIAEAAEVARRAEFDAATLTNAIKAAESASRPSGETQVDTARRIDADATKAETEAAAWEKLAEEIGHALKMLVEKGRTAFEARVQKYLPDGYVFGIDLTDGDRDVCRFGLRSADGALRSALSGVEWAVVTSAIAEAVSAGSPAIIIPEDRSFDARTLHGVLDAFSKCSAQVIIATTTEPAGVPAGWTVIRTGKTADGTRAVPAPAPEVAQAAEPKKRGRGRPKKAAVDPAALNKIVEQDVAKAAAEVAVKEVSGEEADLFDGDPVIAELPDPDLSDLFES